jgi:protein-tyrosine phosphatase
MVCLGNICRSPIAEGILKYEARQLGLDWVVESAGTEPYHVGEPPHRFSQKVCRSHGIDISQQISRQFITADLESYDKIYAFDDDVYDEIRSIAGRNKDISKVDYFLNELKPGSNASVPDPWYGPEEGYEPVYDLINRVCNVIIEKYKK